jgi:hypothetical protein
VVGPPLVVVALELVGPVVLVELVVVGFRVVEVGGAVVVVGRAVELVVEVLATRRPVVAAGRLRRGRVVVEEAPAKRLLGRLVVEGATAWGAGARPGVASPGGAVRKPSRLPPPAPSAIATASMAHRRSRLNLTNAPRPRIPLR